MIPAKSAAEAKTVMDIETRSGYGVHGLASSGAIRIKTYHKMSAGRAASADAGLFLGKLFPGDRASRTSNRSTSAAPKFFEALDQQLKTAPLDDWKVYLRWHVIHASARWLSQPFVDENFNFNGKILQGTKEFLPRWKRCVAATDRQLGEALGQIYVEEVFPARSEGPRLADGAII